MKKWLALLIALVMVAALTTTAIAREPSCEHEGKVTQTTRYTYGWKDSTHHYAYKYTHYVCATCGAEWDGYSTRSTEVHTFGTVSDVPVKCTKCNYPKN